MTDTCETCGHPRDNHQFRHPFKPKKMGRPQAEAPDLGKHLLCLNVFRESDGSVQITTSGHSKLFMSEWERWSFEHPHEPPVRYGEQLIVEAARAMAKRIGAVIKLTDFLKAMMKRYRDRADIAEENALDLALRALEEWEHSGEVIEFTEDCAHTIVDEDLSNWED